MIKPVAYVALLFLLIASLCYTGCQKELPDGGIARGTLKDSSGICFNEIVHGTFYNGIVPGSDTAYVEVKVNVTKPGQYTISTNEQNGLSFSGSGVFVSTGINTVKLHTKGVPLNKAVTGFAVYFDTSECAFSISVHDSAELHPLLPIDNNNWKFTDGRSGITYKGLFENNYLLELGTLKVLVLATKPAQQPGDSTFMINIGLPSGVIKPGNYSTDDAPTGIVFKTFSDACLNCAGGGLIPLSTGATVSLTINSYDETTKIIKGHFSGTTVDWNNIVSQIKDGEFTAVMR